MRLNADGSNYVRELRALLASDLPEIEKLTRVFAAITAQVRDSARRDVELAAALGDRELKIRHQIRLETTETVRRVYQACHRQITGRRAWDEPHHR